MIRSAQHTYIVCITYSRDGNASLTRSEAFALISHTQVMLSCISFIGGFLIFPGALVITPPQGDLPKRRKRYGNKNCMRPQQSTRQHGWKKGSQGPTPGWRMAVRQWLPTEHQFYLPMRPLIGCSSQVISPKPLYRWATLTEPDR